jgi:hypothetical protein
MNVHVSILGVLLAAISAMVIGTLWYSPALFGKQWMKMIGTTEEQMKARMKSVIFVLIIASLLTAYVLAIFTAYMQHFTNSSCLAAGIDTALLAWAGFSMTTIFAHGVFEPRDKRILYINIGNRLVTLLVMGVILGLLM